MMRRAFLDYRSRSSCRLSTLFLAVALGLTHFGCGADGVQLGTQSSALSDPSQLTFPADGATDVDTTSQPFQWTQVADAEAYYLYVGTTAGAKDLVNTGEVQYTARTITGLPYSTTLYATI